MIATNLQSKWLPFINGDKNGVSQDLDKKYAGLHHHAGNLSLVLVDDGRIEWQYVASNKGFQCQFNG